MPPAPQTALSLLLNPSPDNKIALSQMLLQWAVQSDDNLAGAPSKAAQTLSASDPAEQLIKSLAPRLRGTSLLGTDSRPQDPANKTDMNIEQKAETAPRLPFHWPDKVQEHPIMRLMQSLLGHIEREQLQLLQNQDNNYWLPLIINHQQQLHPIELFF